MPIWQLTFPTVPYVFCCQFSATCSFTFPEWPHSHTQLSAIVSVNCKHWASHWSLGVACEQTRSWITSVYDCCLCTTLTWSNLNPTRCTGLWAACCWWSLCSSCDKQEVRQFLGSCGKTVGAVHPCMTVTAEDWGVSKLAFVGSSLYWCWLTLVSHSQVGPGYVRLELPPDHRNGSYKKCISDKLDVVSRSVSHTDESVLLSC